MTINVLLLIEYDGAHFHGWQTQPGVRTVQAELQSNISMILGERIGTVHASGRTDSGVHAKAQVVNFKCQEEPDLRRLKYAISSLLRNNLSVLHAEKVSDDFDARSWAIQKQYSYVVLNRVAPTALEHGKVWHIGRNLDFDILQRDAQALTGTHDFASFRGSGCNAKTTIRTITSSRWEKVGEKLIYRVVGNGFLKHMVRNLVGTMTDRARGKNNLGTIDSILLKKDRTKAGITAPAHGLFLDWVEYPQGRYSSETWPIFSDYLLNKNAP